jgi:hypothetical protein
MHLKVGGFCKKSIRRVCPQEWIEMLVRHRPVGKSK